MVLVGKYRFQFIDSFNGVSCKNEGICSKHSTKKEPTLAI